MVYLKEVTIDYEKQDRYGRTLAKVIVDGQDANLEQVKRGMAWAYAKPTTDSRYFDAEKEARLARRGIWSEDGAAPPWEYRNLEIRWRE